MKVVPRVKEAAGRRWMRSSWLAMRTAVPCHKAHRSGRSSCLALLRAGDVAHGRHGEVLDSCESGLTLTHCGFLAACRVQAGSWEGGRKDPKQMADPVSPAAASFGHLGHNLRHTAMGGHMGLQKSQPDEGFMRALLASREFPQYFPRTGSHRMGGTHAPGRLVAKGSWWPRGFFRCRRRKPTAWLGTTRRSGSKKLAEVAWT